MASPSYNNALLLVRFVGVVFIVFGLLGFAYVGIIVALVVKGAAPDWFIGSVEPYVASATISSPLYVLTGSIMLVISRRLARFVAKHEVEERSDNRIDATVSPS